MISASGCSHVIVGHSERRQYFGETKESVLKKIVAALDAGLTPIVCVGEREKKNVESVLRELSQGQFGRILIAYEPIWAIGDGETDHRPIRAQAKSRFGAQAANEVRMLYGGSVQPDNAKSLMALPKIDGFLVGGASLAPSALQPS